MWIFDSYHKGSVELWSRDRCLNRISEACPESFHLYLKDPHSHWEMIEALESRFRIEECGFRTIYGLINGYQIYADRKVAEKIEQQTNYSAEIYNLDIRLDQRLMAERDIFPCGYQDESRFTPDFEIPLNIMELKVSGDPQFRREITRVEICNLRCRKFEGPEKAVLSDLLGYMKVHDPDVILFPYADQWTPLIINKANKYGLDQTLSRSGWFRHMASKSYWSYGKVNHKDAAKIPEGRILIDTAKSFVYREGGLKGVLLASRLTGLSPNLTSRFTPGTLISSYEVFEAMRRGVAIPFRKRDAECTRDISDLRAADKGGMIFQPESEVRDHIHQIDFTSLYPSIIVKYNLSPETLDDAGKRGFLSSIISPLLDLRIETKRRKKIDPGYKGMDSVLKWMLVTCFGYTGYRNAKFGQIQVHERITAISRELMMQIKEIAEGMNFQVLHGIVDCLWVEGEPISEFKDQVERDTGILTEVDTYDWIAFLPMADGMGAYNRYFGRLDTGRVKVRGVMARRKDTPEYIRMMQMEILETMARARTSEELRGIEVRAREIFQRYIQGLEKVDISELVIHRRVSRIVYSRRCAEASALEAYSRCGYSLDPGMEIGYVVRDARLWAVDAEMNAWEFDAEYYRGLLEKAWNEVAFVFLGALQEKLLVA